MISGGYSIVRIVNKYGYPEYLVRAVKSSLHHPEPGVFGITTLINPPAMRHYRLHHWDDLVTDVDDFLYPMFGTAWHNHVAKFMGECEVAEEQLSIKFEDVIVRGILDVRNFDGTITDHKVTSAWSFVFDKPEWEQQLNLYAFLCGVNGYRVESLCINAFLRDWQEAKAKQYKDYPKKKFHELVIPLWDHDVQMKFLHDRIQDHKNGPRPCTPEERWQKPTVYAVKKKGRQRAVKCCETRVKADDYITSKSDSKLYIEERPGACIRCERYCVARSVCEYRGE
jgi:hypothetical protein